RVGHDIGDGAHHQVGRKKRGDLAGHHGVTYIYLYTFRDILHGHEERALSIPGDRARLSAVLKLGHYTKLIVEHALHGRKVLADIDYGTHDTPGTGNPHIGPYTLVETPVDRQVVGHGHNGVVDDLRFQDSVLEDASAGIHLDGIVDHPAQRIRSFVILFELLAKREIFLYQRFVCLFELEIVLDIVVALVDPAGELRAYIEEGRFMVLIETKKERKGDDLQHQEEEEVEMPSDEEKNVTHLV